MITKEMIDVAAGRTPADTVLKNGFVINVFSGQIEKADVAITNGIICGVGQNYSGKIQYDLEGKYIMPSFVDSHIHIESTQLMPEQLAKLIVPCGTTTLIADPHEIANVLGFEGINILRELCADLPLDIKFMLPSCVPATPFEDNGYVIDSAELKDNLSNFFGVGELMNYVGVISCDEECLAKINAANAVDAIIDGHACTLRGKDLNAYAVAGIKTEHECATHDEAFEKMARGMYVLFRQGSSAQNLVDLLPALNSTNMRRALMCSDDKRISDFVLNGHIDNSLRLAVKNGIDPLWAITMATLNACECYGLKDKGAIAPSFIADIVVADNLKDFNIQAVFKGGKLVAKEGKPLFETSKNAVYAFKNSINIKPLTAKDFEIKLKTKRANVIAVLPNSIVTEKRVRDIVSLGGIVDMSQNPTLCKIAVIERHNASGKIGLGLLEGYGLRNATVALSVSHDSHNIVVAGDNDEDMALAVAHLAEVGGGMTIASHGKILGTLPLEIGGLISTKSCDELMQINAQLEKLAFEFGVKENLEPFMSLSFIALAVIPHLRLTTRGLFDVDKYAFTDIEAD